MPRRTLTLDEQRTPRPLGTYTPEYRRDETFLYLGLVDPEKAQQMALDLQVEEDFLSDLSALDHLLEMGTVNQVQAWLTAHPDFDTHRASLQGLSYGEGRATGLGAGIYHWQKSATDEDAQIHLAKIQALLDHGGWRAHTLLDMGQLSGWMGFDQHPSMYEFNEACRATQIPLIFALADAGMPLNEPLVDLQKAPTHYSGFPDGGYALDMALEQDENVIHGAGGNWVACLLAAGADPRALTISGERWLDARLQIMDAAKTHPYWPNPDPRKTYAEELALLQKRADELDANEVPLPLPSAWMVARQTERREELAAKAAIEAERRATEAEARRPKTLGERLMGVIKGESGTMTGAPSRRRFGR